ncbi:hypothetical protein CG435_12985 [Pantoea ananatis]|uniref:ankyrin repeat domain-containing protein n=1 Tax=Pantoea ananas TaxID=553 RepID=UPI000CF3E50F|nr:ankyrin repeat domain-containing protein [Pantoea ananatis]PQK99983.1 hypothetical protein CG435_12985 [Pantoea ananatis]REF11079.1 hypothetical protein C7428_0248 [Pantoea ananatis]
MKKSIFDVKTESDYLASKDTVDINEVSQDQSDGFVYGYNALWYADEKKSKWLIKHGIDVNHRNCAGENVLFANNTVEKVKLLLKAGVNVKELDYEGNNPLYSFRNREVAVARLLIEAGMSIEPYKDKESFPDEMMSKEIVALINEKILKDSVMREKEVLSEVIHKLENMRSKKRL